MKIAGHDTTAWLKFAARAGQESIGRTKRAAKRSLGIRRFVRLVPYRGFGNGQTAVVSGRVFESRPVREPLIHDPWWINMRHTYRHFTSDVVGGWPVTASYQQTQLDGASDVDGYFRFRFDATGEREPGGGGDTPYGWHPVELTAPGGPAGQDAKAIGQILVPPADSRFGIISDMDDTVIRSHATDFWKIARLTMLKNALTRKPFEGVAAFYRALRAGGDGTRHNPVFYVSSSAWNLFELFRVFLEHNNLPSGPILLRDYGIDEDKFLIEQGHGHKLLKIESIFTMYRSMKFILVGDSGQDDPFLYREAVKLYPGRVLAIYIRDVKPRRREEVRRVADDVTGAGVPMLLVPDTVAAARHAADNGWIDPACLDEVRSDRAADENAAAGRAAPV
ncbi:MAG: phosphatase domain-containing protein [Planctomycetaceae bacterium]